MIDNSNLQKKKKKMGCGASSKSVGVIGVQPCASPTPSFCEQTQKSPMKSATLTATMIPLQIEKKSTSASDSGIGSHHHHHTKLDNESYDSDGISERKNSISSDDCSIYSDQEYKNVITEKSNTNLIQKVEKAFVERNLGKSSFLFQIKVYEIEIFLSSSKICLVRFLFF